MAPLPRGGAGSLPGRHLCRYVPGRAGRRVRRASSRHPALARLRSRSTPCPPLWIYEPSRTSSTTTASTGSRRPSPDSPSSRRSASCSSTCSTSAKTPVPHCGSTSHPVRARRRPPRLGRDDHRRTHPRAEGRPAVLQPVPLRPRHLSPTVDLRAIPYELDDDRLDWVETTIAGLTLEQKVGQLFFNLFHFGQDTFSGNVGSNEEILARYGIGGARYHGGSAPQVQGSLNSLQAASTIPLLI